MSEARARTNSSCAMNGRSRPVLLTAAGRSNFPKTPTPMLAVEAMKRQIRCQSVTPIDLHPETRRRATSQESSRAMDAQCCPGTLAPVGASHLGGGWHAELL